MSAVPARAFQIADTEDEEVQYRAQVSANQVELMRLMPIPLIQLTPSEHDAVQVYQMASLVLGPAAQAPMICSNECPDAFRIPCPLAQVGKHPVGQRCPFEQQYVTERFLSWMQELGKTLQTLLESERSAVTTLVSLDLQERRCNAVLSQAQNAQMSSKSVRDVDQDGEPVAWEEVIHVNAERLNEIIVTRRGILKDLELTREMVTKKQKLLNQLKGPQQSSLAIRQSDKADIIRRSLRGEMIEVGIG